MTAGALRTVELPDRGHLEIRPATSGDVTAIDALYHRLPLDDTYRRFFTAFRVDERFVARVVGFADHGGACLVAELTPGPDGTSQIVAEADFEPLPNGDAEFAITVDPEWRGWLAPYLLDTLVEEAAKRDIPNLQADILAVNRPMLSLIKRRGYAVIGDNDFSVLRVTIGTRTGTPTWPRRHERPRILVESPGGRWHATHAAEDVGFDVVVCPGPASSAPKGCPLLRGEECPLVSGADIVVYALPVDQPPAAALLEAHARHEGRVPLLVEIRRSGQEPATIPPGAMELTEPKPDEIISALQALLFGGLRSRAAASSEPSG